MQVRTVDVIVDGQYGSAGKGQLAGFLAYNGAMYDLVISNSGSQAGHTFKSDNLSDVIVTRHLPVAGVINQNSFIYLSAACVLDLEVLFAEIEKYGVKDRIFVNSRAAIIDPVHKVIEEDFLVKKMGSTGKGNGHALARKIGRVENKIVARDYSKEFHDAGLGHILTEDPYGILQGSASILIEGAQGFSLSIDGPFYPFCTSRNCWVGQAMADAWVHPEDLNNTYMVVRTYPIRVAGNSGPVYSDQHEISWEMLGVNPEVTTVTNRIRRVFTFSHQQLVDAVRVNRPTYLAISHMDYLGNEDKQVQFIDEILRSLHNKVGYIPNLIYGRGPYLADWNFHKTRL